MTIRFDFEFIQTRALAETVPCLVCKVPAGDTCRNLKTGQPLANIAAHQKRIEKARH